MILVCPVILQHHVIKGSYDYRQEPITLSYHPAKFRNHRHSGSGDIIFLVRHVILTL